MCEALNEINKKILGKSLDYEPCHKCSLQCGNAKLYHMSCGELFPSNLLPSPNDEKSGPRIMFVFESPGNFNGRTSPYGTYPEKKCDKLIPEHWEKYWSWEIQCDKNFAPSCQLEIKGKWYGRAIASAAKASGWRNVYATNLIKCGIADANRSQHIALGSTEFRRLFGNGEEQQRTIKDLADRCFNHWLGKEIQLFRPTVIFAMSKIVKEHLGSHLAQEELNNIVLKYLPHPARPLSQQDRQKLWRETICVS